MGIIGPLREIVFINKTVQSKCTFFTKSNIFKDICIRSNKLANMFMKFVLSFEVIFAVSTANLNFHLLFKLINRIYLHLNINFICVVVV